VSAEPTTVLRPASPVNVSAVSSRLPLREDRTRVIQVGPDLQVHGGVSSVEQLICDYLPAYAQIRHIPTMNEGSWLSRGWMFARAVVALSRAMDTVEPTVVHIHFASRGSMLRKMMLVRLVVNARRPLILHAHGAAFDKFHRGLPAPIRRLVNRTLQQANVFIALSSQWRDFYIRECELAPSQVIVLSNPVKVPARVPERAGRSEVQFVHFGRLCKWKGTHDLVNAFAALPAGLRERSRLVLAGSGDVDELRKLAEGLGDRVRFISWINPVEREKLLAESDVFVLPSYGEGVPMSLLESMAAGLPSICCPVGGVPDVFTHGVEGISVQPGDRAQLTAAMEKYILDESARLAAGRRGYERARPYDVHAYARRLAEIYQRIAPVAEVKPGQLESGA
jgi:glycosyltransferase involved in cell wall biosynthesis